MSVFTEYFDDSHRLVRDSVRRFVEREILPMSLTGRRPRSFPASCTARPARRASLALVIRKRLAAATRAICLPRWQPAKS